MLRSIKLSCNSVPTLVLRFSCVGEDKSLVTLGGGGFKPLTGGSARAPPIRLQNEVMWMRDSLKAWLTSQRQTRSYRTVKTQVKTHCFMVPYAMVTSRTLKFARSHVVALLSATNNLEI